MSSGVAYQFINILVKLSKLVEGGRSLGVIAPPLSISVYLIMFHAKESRDRIVPLSLLKGDM